MQMVPVGEKIGHPTLQLSSHWEKGGHGKGRPFGANTCVPCVLSEKTAASGLQHPRGGLLCPARPSRVFTPRGHVQPPRGIKEPLAPARQLALFLECFRQILRVRVPGPRGVCTHILFLFCSQILSVNSKGHLPLPAHLPAQRASRCSRGQEGSVADQAGFPSVCRPAPSLKTPTEFRGAAAQPARPQQRPVLLGRQRRGQLAHSGSRKSSLGISLRAG